MIDYISREAAVTIADYAADEYPYDKDPKKPETYSDYNQGWNDACDYIRGELDDEKSADVEPVRHGNWNIQRSHKSALCLVCSACGRKVDNDAIGILLVHGENGVARHLYPYCHCGAKMDLEGEILNPERSGKEGNSDGI